MPAQSSLHAYLNWTKERIDEMDATLASLESKALRMQAESKAKADQLVAEMKKRRDEFEALSRKHAEAGEAAWLHAKAQLESQWRGFEDQVKSYFGSVDTQVEHQRATFQKVADAQAKAWREAADKFHREASRITAGSRAEIDSAVEHMKQEAALAGTRMQTLKQAGRESWTAFSAALAESRKAFDRANQQVWDALKRSAPPKA